MSRIGVVIVALCGLASPAAAQVNPEAEVLFRQGKSLIRDGKITEACDAFEASERVEHSVATVLCLADCREKNHQLATAWALFVQADGQTRGDPAKAALNRTARTRAAALESRLSYLTVSVPNESRVEGLTLTRNGKPFDSTLWNRTLPVDGGDYVIAGRAPATEAWQTTAHIADAEARVSVDVPKLKEAVKLVPVALARVAPAAPPSPSHFTPRRKLALGLAGGAVVGGVVGALLGVSASSKKDDAYRLCPATSMPCEQAARANSLLDSGRTRALGANVAFGVGAALVIGAGVLWFTGAPAEDGGRRVQLLPSVGADQAGIVVAGRL